MENGDGLKRRPGAASSADWGRGADEETETDHDDATMDMPTDAPTEPTAEAPDEPTAVEPPTPPSEEQPPEPVDADDTEPVTPEAPWTPATDPLVADLGSIEDAEDPEGGWSDPPGGETEPVLPPEPDDENGRSVAARGLWTVAALLAVALLALLLWNWADDNLTADAGDSGPTGEYAAAEFRIAWIFEQAHVVPGDDYALMGLWPHGGRPADLLGMTWSTNRVGFLGGTLDDDGTGVGNVTIDPAPDGPRFGEDGYNATRVTLFAFDEDAELLATTASVLERDHIPWIDPDFFFELDDIVYYLGDADEAPEGTEHLPEAARSFKQQIRDIATGLPVGGVASAFVPEDEWPGGDFMGGLFLTARIDELVVAP